MEQIWMMRWWNAFDWHLQSTGDVMTAVVSGRAIHNGPTLAISTKSYVWDLGCQLLQSRREPDVGTFSFQ